MTSLQSFSKVHVATLCFADFFSLFKCGLTCHLSLTTPSWVNITLFFPSQLLANYRTLLSPSELFTFCPSPLELSSVRVGSLSALVTSVPNT